MIRWKVIENKNIADVMVEVFGKDEKNLLNNIIEAFTSIVSKIEEIEENRNWKMEVREKNLPELIFRFIEKLIYLKDTQGLLFKKGQFILIKNKDLILKADLFGEKISKKIPIKIDIKALTRHKFKVEKKKIYKVTLVFDI